MNEHNLVGRRQFVKLSAAAATSTFLFGITSCAPSGSESNAAVPQYQPGTYTAEAEGRKSIVKVKVIFDENNIESIDVTADGETARIANCAIDAIPPKIIEYQSLGVDTVTGATLTSMAILNATADCVKQAGGDPGTLKKAPAGERNTETIELEADIVVIGSGASGMAAAISAAQNGKKVVIFEQASNIGGNALVCGGYVEFPEAPDSLRQDLTDGYEQYFKDTLKNRTEAGADLAIIDEVQAQWDTYYSGGSTKLFDSSEFTALDWWQLEGGVYESHLKNAKNIQAACEWLTGMGLSWLPLTGVVGYPYPHYGHPVDSPNGEGYFDLFDAEMESNSLAIDILFATRASELVVSEGKVVGAIGLCSNGATYKVSANSGVVLATGGYSGNPEMLRKYDKMWGWDKIKSIPTTNNYNHVGDGITMAMEVGAVFDDSLPFNHMVFPFADKKDYATETIVGDSGCCLLVNAEGYRFINETGSRTDLTRAIMEQTDGLAYIISDNKNCLIEDGRNYFMQDIESLIENGQLFVADTLEALAEQINIAESVLVQTVEKYNEAAISLVDNEFGRTTFKPESTITEAPFYASPRTWATHITLDGLKTNSNWEVLDAQEEPIPGLYAVGEVVSGVLGMRCMGGGLELGRMLSE